MDLSNLTIAGSGKLTLRHPSTGEPLDITINVHGKDSPEYRKIMAKIGNRHLRDARGKRSVEQLNAEGLDIVCAVTESWQNMVEHGEDIPCTAENVRRIYSENSWIREQVDEFVHDRANFMMDA